MLVLMAGTLMVAAPIMMVGGIIMARARTSACPGWSSPWCRCSASPSVSSSAGWCRSFRLMQERIDEVNRLLREQITGVRVVRAFVREQHETTRFADANAQLTEVAIRAGRCRPRCSRRSCSWPTSRTVGGALVRRAPRRRRPHGGRRAHRVHLLPDADRHVGDDGDVHADDGPARRGVRRPDHRGARHRSSVVAAGRRRHRAAERRALDLDAVTFAYPGADEPVLREVTMTARPGETIAIIGSTGAGKSTLVNLVPRLFDATGGAVRSAGSTYATRPRDCCGPGSAWCRRRPSSSAAPSRRTCDTASPTRPTRRCGGARDRPGEGLRRGDARGLESEVAQGGTNLSGGQRQRLAIARAVVRARRSTCSTTPSRRSTSPPTPGCGRR